MWYVFFSKWYTLFPPSFPSSSPENKIFCHWAWGSIAVRWNMVIKWPSSRHALSHYIDFDLAPVNNQILCIIMEQWLKIQSGCNTKPTRYLDKCIAEFLTTCILYSWVAMNTLSKCSSSTSGCYLVVHSYFTTFTNKQIKFCSILIFITEL